MAVCVLQVTRLVFILDLPTDFRTRLNRWPLWLFDESYFSSCGLLLQAGRVQRMAAFLTRVECICFISFPSFAICLFNCSGLILFFSLLVRVASSLFCVHWRSAKLLHFSLSLNQLRVWLLLAYSLVPPSHISFYCTINRFRLDNFGIKAFDREPQMTTELAQLWRSEQTQDQPKVGMLVVEWPPQIMPRSDGNAVILKNHS